MRDLVGRARTARPQPRLTAAFAEQAPRQDRSDDDRDNADRLTDLVRAHNNLEMREQAIEVKQRREAEKDGGDQRERLVTHLNPPQGGTTITTVASSHQITL